MLHPDALAHVLTTVPADVWGKNWVDTNTQLLRCTSKTLQQLIDGLRPGLPTALWMCPDFWFRYPVPGPVKWAHVLDRLVATVARARVTRLRLFSTVRVHGLRAVLTVCQLRSFSISSNGNMGADGAGVLPSRCARPRTSRTSACAATTCASRACACSRPRSSPARSGTSTSA
jgi:hypothetical protein